MTIFRAFLTIAASGLGFAYVGCGLGYALGALNPGYYRAVFRNGHDPDFDPVAVGIGLGLTQGLIGGVVIGLIVVFIVAWYRSRIHFLESRDFSPTK